MSFSNILHNFRVFSRQINLQKKSCTFFFSSKPPQKGIIKELDPDTGTMKTKKTNIIPKITLVSGDSVTITTLQDAEKLSKRRDLRLVKIVDLDTKSQRPVYQLMTGSEYHAEDLKQREKRKLERQKTTIKGEKVLLINSKIASHDVDFQLKKASKWLKKHYEVRIVISGASGSMEAAEKVYATIEQYFKNEDPEAKIVQKRCKGSDIKFQIIPPTNKEVDKEL